MKKILSALVVLLALGAAGAAVYLFQKGGRRGAATTAAVDFLPAQTLLLLSVPDLNGTTTDWKTTDLYKIWSEPDVQAFLAKPLSKVPANADLPATLAQVAKLDPKNLFIALTVLDEKTNQPHLVAGFQFNGSRSDVDALLAGPKDQLRQHFPAGKADLINYQGHSIETFDAGDNNTVASAYLGDWYVVANDLNLLKSTLDRLEHRVPTAAEPALDKDADYQAVLAKLPPNHATLIFARAQPFVTRALALAAASGQPVDAERRDAAEKLRAIGATTRIENGKLRDTIYALAPGRPPSPAVLQMNALPLASTDTLFFGAGVFDLPTHLDLPGMNPDGAADSPVKNPLGDLTTMLQAHGLKLADLRAAFGNEFALQLDWPADSAQPRLLTSLDVRDHVAAAKFVDNLTNTLSAEDGWQTSQADGLAFHTLASPGVSFVSPTLTLSARHLILGLNPPEVHEAAKRENAVTPNFTQSENYKTAMAAVEKPNVAFAYLDSRAFFERLYGALKPVAMLGAAFVLPQAGEYVDLGKLPPAEAISKHLSPTVLSETSDGQGILLESVGSFTCGEAAVVVVGGSVAAAIPVLEKRFGLTPGGKPSSAQPGPGE